MGDSRRSTQPATHPYTQHSSAIHSEHHTTSPRPAAPAYLATSLPARSLHHPAAHARPQPVFYLHHFLPVPVVSALGRVEYAYQPAVPIAVPAGAKYPTVIVSPHYQPTTCERDSSHPAVKNRFTTSHRVRTQLDGHNGTQSGVPRSAPPMTSQPAATMTRRDDRAPSYPRNGRPSLVSQTSNSVPSTPLQLARQYESRSRSPSPNGGLGSHSPRSVSSEANGPLPTLRAQRPNTCPYEGNNFAFGRRRIPYTCAEILETPKEEPKKSLDPHEDEKLSGDMRELYDRLLPSEESERRRKAFVTKVEEILHKEFPGNEFNVHVFGSSGNMLYTSESDVDICIQTPMKRLEEMHMLADALARNGMQRVVCIPQAKVRIVKVWDPELELASDMNVNNTLALENTRMIKTYIQIDDRVRPLAMIVKHWTKQRILNDAAMGGTISSYTWICMILNFLQTRDPPIIPTLHKMPLSYRKKDEATGQSRSEFADDMDQLKGFGRNNRESIGQLLFHFFRSYGYEVDFEKKVVSVREGKLITRKEKNWHREGLQKEGGNRLCVEEPFNTERNLGNSADDYSWHGIHLEIRRAFDLLADGGQLAKACEQFEFPAQEEKTPFKRPTPSVKPILQAPNGRGRVQIGGRGGRGGFAQKNNYGSQRRSSSSASYGANRPPIPMNGPLPPIAGQQHYATSPRGLNDHLHDHLMNQYINLEMQQNILQAQLDNQRVAHQAHQAEQVRVAQMLRGAVVQAQSQRAGQNGAHSSVQQSPYVNGPTSPQLSEIRIQPNHLHHQFIYPYPYFDPTLQLPPSSQDSPRTNPSSPLPNNTVLRRSAHRLSNASDTGSRSQSQPAPGVGQPVLVPSHAHAQHYFEPSNASGYPIARSTPEVAPIISAPEPKYNPLSAYTETVSSAEPNPPREYVGYYVEPLAQQYKLQEIPSYNDLHPRRSRVPAEVAQNTARRASRSPSPLPSTAVTVSAPSDSKTKDRSERLRPGDDNGPVIVNGSFPIRVRESNGAGENLEAFPSYDALSLPHEGFYNHDNGESFGCTSEPYHHVYHDETQPQTQVEVTLNANMANGVSPEAAPVEANGLTGIASGGNQPFSPPADAWMSNGSVNGHYGNQTVDISPTRSQAQMRQPASYGSGPNAIDTKNAPRAPPQEIKSAGVPVLSPVLETRTPSPTASRQQDSQKMVNGANTQPKESHHHRRGSQTPKQGPSHKEHAKEGSRSSHQKSNTQNSEKANKPHQLSTNNAGTWQSSSTNTWQPSSTKKNKKKKGKQGGDQKLPGEPMPANASERKGG